MICDKCAKEDVLVVEMGHDHWLVRARRMSKCRHYKPGKYGQICSKEIMGTRDDAVKEWEFWVNHRDAMAREVRS